MIRGRTRREGAMVVPRIRDEFQVAQQNMHRKESIFLRRRCRTEAERQRQKLGIHFKGHGARD